MIVLIFGSNNSVNSGGLSYCMWKVRGKEGWEWVIT